MPKRVRARVPILAAATLLVPGALCVRAQEAVPTPRTRPAAEALATLGRSAGVVILADSTVLGRLPTQTAAVTRDTVETRLAELVRLLPAGTTWIKLYAPTPINGRWDGDVVADYARAQIRLLGTAVRPAPAGMVEILGRYVPSAKASEHISALNLTLVYLVTNPRAPNLAQGAANWLSMSPEQREAYAQQQAQRFLSLDPASRIEALASMMDPGFPDHRSMILNAVNKRLSPEERIQLKQAIGARAERHIRLKESQSGGK